MPATDVGKAVTTRHSAQKGEDLKTKWGGEEFNVNIAESKGIRTLSVMLKIRILLRMLELLPLREK